METDPGSATAGSRAPPPDSERLRLAYDRLRWLQQGPSVLSGLKSGISVANVPLSFGRPPVLPLSPTLAHNELEWGDREDCTDAHLKQHIRHLHCVDLTYPLHRAPPQLKIPEGAPRSFPVSPHAGSRSGREVEASAQNRHRTCARCWTAVGSLYCQECTAFLCAPCAVVTHSEGETSKHRVGAAPHARGPEALTDSTLSSLDPRFRHPHPHTVHPAKADNYTRKAGHHTHLAGAQYAKETLFASPRTLLRLRPLPDADNRLPPMPKSIPRFSSSGNKMCPTHPNVKLSHACVTCQCLPVCALCVDPQKDGEAPRDAPRHQNHKLVTLDEAATQVRKWLNQLNDRVHTQLKHLRHAERALRLMERSAPVMVQGLKVQVEEAYQCFFDCLAQKYTAIHDSLAVQKEQSTKTVRLLSEDNLKFRRYLLEFKLPQLQGLVHLGNRRPAAGLNAYVTMHPALRPLLSETKDQHLIDGGSYCAGLRHPWWSLNVSDAREALGNVEKDWQNVSETGLQQIARVGYHVQRYLRPSHTIETFYQRPSTMQTLANDKLKVYAAADCLADLKPISLPYRGPIPYTPEFDKLVPSLEIEAYRKDPLNDWSAVRVLVVTPFLVILKADATLPTVDNETGSLPKPTFRHTETVVPLLEGNLSIQLFSSSSISALTKREVQRVQKDLKHKIAGGVEILRRGQAADGPRQTVAHLLPTSSQKHKTNSSMATSNRAVHSETNIRSILCEPVIGYWLLAVKEKSALDALHAELQRLRGPSVKTSSLKKLWRTPLVFPGALPPQVGVRHPPIPSTHRVAAVGRLGIPLKPPSNITVSFQESPPTDNNSDTNSQSLQPEPIADTSSHFTVDHHELSDDQIPTSQIDTPLFPTIDGSTAHPDDEKEGSITIMTLDSPSYPSVTVDATEPTDTDLIANAPPTVISPIIPLSSTTCAKNQSNLSQVSPKQPIAVSNFLHETTPDNLDARYISLATSLTSHRTFDAAETDMLKMTPSLGRKHNQNSSYAMSQPLQVKAQPSESYPHHDSKIEHATKKVTEKSSTVEVSDLLKKYPDQSSKSTGAYANAHFRQDALHECQGIESATYSRGKSNYAAYGSDIEAHSYFPSTKNTSTNIARPLSKCRALCRRRPQPTKPLPKKESLQHVRTISHVMRRRQDGRTLRQLPLSSIIKNTNGSLRHPSDTMIESRPNTRSTSLTSNDPNFFTAHKLKNGMQSYTLQHRSLETTNSTPWKPYALDIYSDIPDALFERLTCQSIPAGSLDTTDLVEAMKLRPSRTHPVTLRSSDSLSTQPTNIASEQPYPNKNQTRLPQFPLKDSIETQMLTLVYPDTSDTDCTSTPPEDGLDSITKVDLNSESDSSETTKSKLELQPATHRTLQTSPKTKTTSPKAGHYFPYLTPAKKNANCEKNANGSHPFSDSFATIAHTKLGFAGIPACDKILTKGQHHRPIRRLIRVSVSAKTAL